MIINFDINMISSSRSAFIVADLLSPVEPFLLVLEWYYEMIMSRSRLNCIAARRETKGRGNRRERRVETELNVPFVCCLAPGSSQSLPPPISLQETHHNFTPPLITQFPVINQQ